MATTTNNERAREREIVSWKEMASCCWCCRNDCEFAVTERGAGTTNLIMDAPRAGAVGVGY